MFRLISSIGLVMVTYAGFALLGPVLGAADFKMALFLANPVWTVPLPSGGTWPVEIGAIFLLLGLTALGIETLTTARAAGRTIGYRALSILWLAGGAALFLLVEGFGTLAFPPAGCDGLVRCGSRIAGAGPEQPAPRRSRG